MADHNTITRRLFMANTSAAALAGTVVTAAASLPDEVAELSRRLAAVKAKVKEALAAEVRADRDYIAFVKASMPPELTWRPEDNALQIAGAYDLRREAAGGSVAYHASLVECHRRTLDRVPEMAGTTRAARIREIVKAHDAHAALCEGSATKRAIESAEEAVRDALVEMDSVVREIAARPAREISGLRLKVEALAVHSGLTVEQMAAGEPLNGDNELSGLLLASIARDVMALGDCAVRV